MNRTPPRIAPAVAAAVLWAAATPAVADTLSGIRGLLEEREHRIEITMTPGHATLVVRRTVENLGPRHDQADWQIQLPDAAVATLLRTRGTVDGRLRWFDGVLMEAEEAAAKYQHLTGVGGYYPKDPALLSWREKGHLALQVFPVPPGDRKTVSYTLKLPTSYAGGRHVVSLPVLGLAASPAVVLVRPARVEDRILVGDQPFPIGGRIARTDGELTEVALAPAWAPTLAGALAVKTVGPARVLVHYRVEAAPRLGQVPRGAQVVVILDASRSVSDEAWRAGVAGASAFLHAFEDASVEVLTVDREVHRRHGRFVPVGRALVDLQDLEVQRRNGSSLDAALARADELLAAQPAGHARRVLMLSDLLTRDALAVSRLQTRLRKSGALLHVANVDVGEPALSPDDESAWAAVARATGGLAWQAALTTDEDARLSLLAAAEEWARPMHLRRLHVVVPGVELKPDAGDEALEQGVLDEGAGVSGLQLANGEPPWLEVAGELWSRPVRVRLAPDPAESRLWSALVFGTELVDQLTEKEMMVLARYGGAVSPVTSYLAIEPGVRPSTAGITEDEAYGVGGLGMVGTGSGGYGSGEGGLGKFDAVRWLRNELDAARERCGYGSRKVSIDIETTRDEVVDVPRVTGPRGGDRGCLREAAWALDLPSAFDDEHRTWTVTWGGG